MKLKFCIGSSKDIFLLADNWEETGAYARVTTTVLIPAFGVNADIPLDGTTDTANVKNGKFYLVPGRLIDLDTTKIWEPIKRIDTDAGPTYKLAESVAEAIENLSPAKVNPADPGNYMVTYEDLPGDVSKYYHITQNATEATYSCRLFYVSNSGNTEPQLVDIETANAFNRVISSRVYIPNFENRLYTQKLDDSNMPVDGAVFALISRDKLLANNLITDEKAIPAYSFLKNLVGETYNNNSLATVYTNETPLVVTATTGFLKDDPAPDGTQITRRGSVSFRKIPAGHYYLIEVSAPDEYQVNKTVTLIHVKDTKQDPFHIDLDGYPNGVYAEAGTVNDGVSVICSVIDMKISV